MQKFQEDGTIEVRVSNMHHRDVLLADGIPVVGCSFAEDPESTTGLRSRCLGLCDAPLGSFPIKIRY